jgi:hypothetical protein
MGYKNILITHCFIWSQRAELNRRPTDYETDSLAEFIKGYLETAELGQEWLLPS